MAKVLRIGGEAPRMDGDKSHFTPEQRRILEEKLAALRSGEYVPKPESREAVERYADGQYGILSRKLRKLYADAVREIETKGRDFARAHEARVKKYRAQVARGEITEADFHAWMRGQLFQERQWKEKRIEMARLLADADREAMRIINDGKQRVFAESVNYLSYELEKRAGADLGFALYDTGAVRRLVRDSPQLLPLPKVDRKRDIAWYNRMITNAVSQGILQGESLDQIAFRVATETGEKSLTAIRRNAQAAYRGAMNAGQIEGMRRASDMGLEVRKRWECRFDNKVRDAHDLLDGQEVAWDEPFQSILGPIMYPGDPSADPANVYNCRCKMRKIYPQYDFALVRRDEDGNDVGGMTYREWKAAKGAA